MSVRVRFAPSPTGFLHVGGVRTALYNWLFARHHGGTAVLRIEDTDAEREEAGAIEQIQRSLDWLGLSFDESPSLGGAYGPYLQSRRGQHYQATVDQLLTEGLAYRCFQTPEELEAARADARQTDDPASPTRQHRDLTSDEIRHFEAAGRVAVIRFRTPLEGETVVDDLVRGRVVFEHRLLGDHVLMRGGRSAHVSARKSTRRYGDGDHARDSRRGPIVVNAAAKTVDRSAWWDISHHGASLDDSWHRQEALI